MNIVLFDDPGRLRLLPFTHTRPVADIRCGILTMRERWEKYLSCTTGSLTVSHLQEAFPLRSEGKTIYINGAVFANEAIAKAILDLESGQSLVREGTIIAVFTDKAVQNFSELEKISNDNTSHNNPFDRLNAIWDIFSMNDRAIRDDFRLLTKDRSSGSLPEGIHVRGAENIFIEEGAQIGAGVVINAETGPVYIGKNAEIMEGSLLRGPLALCEGAVIKMGAKIYSGTTIGPGCKVGGEVSNVVFFANSNKGHDGFLGNAVIGEWCNLGADTNCSNLKNNYDEVKIWDEDLNKSVRTGLTFCGLLMGDHSKCGINTMFNTGTVVGVSANIYGGNFPEKFIPSFSWGGSERMVTYDFNKAMETAGRMMARRNRELSDSERKAYEAVFELTSRQRTTFLHD